MGVSRAWDPRYGDEGLGSEFGKLSYWAQKPINSFFFLTSRCRHIVQMGSGDLKCFPESLFLTWFIHCDLFVPAFYYAIN